MYNQVVINHHIRWSSHVQADLDGVYQQDDADGLFMDELFDVLDDSEELRECLALGRFQQIADPRFDAAPLQWAKDDGYNIYYLKMWRKDGQLLPARLIYAVKHGVRDTYVWVLGLMDRGDEYEPTSSFGQRLRTDYDSYGIPRVPGRQFRQRR